METAWNARHGAELAASIEEAILWEQEQGKRHRRKEGASARTSEAGSGAEAGTDPSMGIEGSMEGEDDEKKESVRFRDSSSPKDPSPVDNPEETHTASKAEPDILASEELDSEDEGLKEERNDRGNKVENGQNMDTYDQSTEDNQEDGPTSGTPGLEVEKRNLRPASKRKVPIKVDEEASVEMEPERRRLPVDPLELLGTVALETALQDVDEDEEAARTLSAVGGGGTQRKSGRKAVPSSRMAEEEGGTKTKRSKACRSCGNRDVTRWWGQDTTLCSPCGRLYAQGSFCPICQRVYRARDSTPMIQCDKCSKWVHAECEGMTQEEYLNMADDTEYFCPFCSGEPAKPVKKAQPKAEARPAPPPKKQKKVPKAPSPGLEAAAEVSKKPPSPAAGGLPGQTGGPPPQWSPMFPPGGIPPMMHPAMIPFMTPQRVILPPSMLASVPKVIRLSIMQGRQNFANMWAMANQYLAHMSTAAGSQGKTVQSMGQGMVFPQLPAVHSMGGASQAEHLFGLPMQQSVGTQDAGGMSGGTQERKIDSKVESKAGKPSLSPKQKKTTKTGSVLPKTSISMNLLSKKPSGNAGTSLSTPLGKLERGKTPTIKPTKASLESKMVKATTPSGHSKLPIGGNPVMTRPVSPAANAISAGQHQLPTDTGKAAHHFADKPPVALPLPLESKETVQTGGNAPPHAPVAAPTSTSGPAPVEALLASAPIAGNDQSGSAERQGHE